MNVVAEGIRRIRWALATDRVGPDILVSQVILSLPRTGYRYCKRKFHAFGQAAQVRPGVTVVGCSSVALGRRVVLRPGTTIVAAHIDDVPEPTVDIRDDALIGGGTHIYVNNHEFRDPARRIIEQGHQATQPVVIGEGAWLGANVTVLPGVTIGVHAVVGAGSVVTRSIPDYAVAVGNPAHVIQTIGGQG